MSLPSFRDHFNVLFYNGFNNCNLLFLESMIIYLFDWRDVGFRLTIILNDMNMYRFMVV